MKISSSSSSIPADDDKQTSDKNYLLGLRKAFSNYTYKQKQLIKTQDILI
jgi:hypothetical protein